MATITSHTFPGGAVFALVQGDLTTMTFDAIVNAANAQLQHGGGLAAAIARRGGPAIQQESDAWVRRHGPARPDRPAVTGAGRLPCRFVIHAVGPVWGEGEPPRDPLQDAQRDAKREEDRKLAAAVRASLETAASLPAETVGLPAISTGIFGFPKPRAAEITCDAVALYLTAHPSGAVRRVDLVLFDSPTLEIFRDAFNRRLSPDR
jgi:O-acetyl-ADP-ribose deacetylase (regulator of RNase III)